MGIKLLLAYLTYIYPRKEFAIPAILLAFGWIILWTFDLRQEGPEVLNSNHVIWWNDLRPLHAFIYILFAYNIYHSNPNAYQYLIFDVMIGLGAFLLKN